MNLLIHLCRKDYSFAKHALWSAWAVFMLAVLMPAYITGTLGNAAAPVLGLLYAAPLFLVFNATLKILRADSFTGGNAFMGTRPVTTTMLWLSKLVAITAFVLLPWLFSRVYGVWVLHVELTPTDWVLFFAEKTLLFGLPASIALIVGTHTRNFVFATMLIFAFGALLLWLAVTIFGRPRGLDFIMEGRHLRASQWLVAQAMIYVTTILLAWLWITQRRILWSIGAGVITLAAIAVVSMLWKVDFVERLIFIKVAMESELRISWLGEPQTTGDTRNRVPFTVVFREARIEGVPDGWVAIPSGVRSNARFRDGSLVAGETTNSRSHGDFTRALLPSLGVELPLSDSGRHVFGFGATWFEAATSLLRDRIDSSATISGDCMVELAQPVILANLPARSGVGASHGRFRYRFDQVEAASGVISLKIEVSGIDIASRGDMSNRQDDFEILIINPKIGKHTHIGSMSGGSTVSSGWVSISRSLSIDDGPPGPDQTITDPHVFLTDARIYLIGRRYGGTVRVPFEMKDVVLKPGR